MPQFVYIVNALVDGPSSRRIGRAKVYFSREEVLQKLGPNYSPGTSTQIPFQFPEPSGGGRDFFTNYHYGRDRYNPEVKKVHEVQIGELVTQPGIGSSSSSSSSSAAAPRSLANGEDPTSLQGGKRKRRGKRKTRKNHQV